MTTFGKTTTPRYERVLMLAEREARALGHNYIGTEHLLLGLLREGEGLGAGVLLDVGVTYKDALERIQRITGPQR